MNINLDVDDCHDRANSDTETQYQCQEPQLEEKDQTKLHLVQNHIQGKQVNTLQLNNTHFSLVQHKKQFNFRQCSIAKKYQQHVFGQLIFKRYFSDSYRNVLAKKILNVINRKVGIRLLQKQTNKNIQKKIFYQVQNSFNQKIVGAKCGCGKIYRTYRHFKKHIALKHQNKTPVGTVLNFKQFQKLQYDKFGKFVKQNDFDEDKIGNYLKQVVSSQIKKKLYHSLCKIKERSSSNFKVQLLLNKQQKIATKFLKNIYKINKDYFQLYKCKLQIQKKFMSLSEHVSVFALNFKFYLSQNNNQKVFYIIVENTLLKWTQFINQNFQKAIDSYEETTKSLLILNQDLQQFQNTKQLYLVPFLIKNYFEQKNYSNNAMANTSLDLENCTMEMFWTYLRAFDFTSVA